MGKLQYSNKKYHFLSSKGIFTLTEELYQHKLAKQSSDQLGLSPSRCYALAKVQYFSWRLRALLGLDFAK